MIPKTGSKAAAVSRRPASSTPAPKAAPKAAQATSFKRDELSTGRGGALRANAQKYLGAQMVSAICPPPPQRTAELAIAQAKALFVKSTDTTGTIGGAVTDYFPVTDNSFSAAAQAQLEKNKALEQKAVAALSKDDQQRYADVQAKLTDPTAKLAMQTMLLEGRLPGEKDLRDGKTLLQQLDGLSKQEFAPGLAGADQILDQTVKEVFIPAAIGQGYEKLTCGATSGLAALAVENPAEYVRLVSGLASPEGSVELANGDSLVREPGTLDADPATIQRSVTQRLLGPAAMEYANGFLPYDNEHDTSMIFFGGLTTGMEERLLEGLFNRDFTSRFNPLDPKGLADEAIAAIDRGESPVAVAMSWPSILDGHIVVIDRLERTSEGTFVIIRNPWGQEERLPYETFKDHLNGVVFPTEQPMLPPGNWI